MPPNQTGDPMRRTLRLLSLSWLAALGACGSFHAPEVVAARLERAMTTAAERHATGDDVVAHQFVEMVREIDATYPGAEALALELEGEEFLFDRPLLGSNLRRRPQVDRSVAAHVFLYLPDRLLDLLDCVSFDVHLGLGVLANVHVTRAVQVGVGGRAVGGIGWHDHRSLGFLGATESEAVLPGIGTQAYAGGLVGTSGVFGCADTLAGLHRPSKRIYQNMRDYWAVGASVTALVAGVDVDLHPVEFADFLVGFSTFDFLHDDFAATAGLGTTAEEDEQLKVLTSIRRSGKTMEAYAAWKGDA